LIFTIRKKQLGSQGQSDEKLIIIARKHEDWNISEIMLNNFIPELLKAGVDNIGFLHLAVLGQVQEKFSSIIKYYIFNEQELLHSQTIDLQNYPLFLDMDVYPNGSVTFFYSTMEDNQYTIHELYNIFSGDTNWYDNSFEVPHIIENLSGRYLYPYTFIATQESSLEKTSSLKMHILVDGVAINNPVLISQPGDEEVTLKSFSALWGEAVVSYQRRIHDVNELVITKLNDDFSEFIPEKHPETLLYDHQAILDYRSMMHVIAVDDQSYYSSLSLYSIKEITDYIINSELYLLRSGDCSPVSVPEEIIQSQLKAFPNPAVNFLKVTGLRKGQKASIEIYDISGKKVLIKTPNDFEMENEIIEIDISSLNYGLYLLKVASDTSVETVKFLKK
jgi:hypothetical protein